jgi:hypothetical protein
MNEYPRMLYKFKVGGPVELQDGRYETHIVQNDEEHRRATEQDGWYLTSAAARDAHFNPPAQEVFDASEPIADEDNKAPTREELEQKAAEIGLVVDRRWGNVRLYTEIEQRLAAEHDEEA